MAEGRAPNQREPTIALGSPPGGARRPEVIFCPRCGRRNDAGEIYCQVCALPLQPMAGCRHCAAAIPANAAYCPACGRRLTPG